MTITIHAPADDRAAQHMPQALRCRDVYIEREGLPLIEQLEFTANSGDIWVIQGANGSGKSTLLKAMAGLFPIASGQITIGDEDIKQHPDYPNILIFMGHKSALKLGMSVYDNVAFWAKLRGTEELIDAAIEYFDLAPYRDMECAMLSAGWQQRVILTRLLTMPARIWLLDEPMTHLDTDGIALIQSLMVSRAEQDGIILMSSHAKIQSDKVKILNINNL